MFLSLERKLGISCERIEILPYPRGYISTNVWVSTLRNQRSA